jgi:hypothetical protein
MSAPGRPSSSFLFPPSRMRGEVERREALKLPRSCETRRAPCDRCARLSALHLRRSHCGAGPRFSSGTSPALARRRPVRQPAPGGGPMLPPGGAPAPPGARFARPCSGRRTGAKAGNCPAPNHRGQGHISGPPPRSAPPAERLRKAPLGERGGWSVWETVLGCKDYFLTIGRGCIRRIGQAMLGMTAKRLARGEEG